MRIDRPLNQGELLGCVNDESNPVGQVHFGFVHLVDVALPCVYPREEGLLDMYFRPVEEMVEDQESFETWSQLILQALAKSWL